jgi:hypothetical protein
MEHNDHEVSFKPLFYMTKEIQPACETSHLDRSSFYCIFT